MGYKLLFEQNFKDEWDALDKSVKLIAKKVVRKIGEKPECAKRLTGFSNRFRARFLNYRIIYYIEGDSIIFVSISKRARAYR
ncbi:MAG: type II toxin-antitoxin system RelE/ParE family toxin [Candidatus Micrarchaeota archaeon]